MEGEEEEKDVPWRLTKMWGSRARQHEHPSLRPNMSVMAVEMDSNDTTRYRRLEAVVSLLCSHHVMPQCAPVRILIIIMVVFFPRRHCGWCGVVPICGHVRGAIMEV